LLAVGGIYEIDLNNEEVNDILVIDEEEGKKVHHYFESLFRNRLFSDYSKKISRTPPKEENSFRPTINPDSENLA
jgi:AAA+ superfamily predicted ATPase